MLVGDRHIARLDVEVVAELLPAHLHRAREMRLGFSVGLPAARRASCQRRLSASPPSMHASDEPIVDVPMALRARGVPEAGDHRPAARLDRGRLRVLVLVDHVLVGRSRSTAWSRTAHPRADEGREVQARVAVEHRLVVHDLVRRPRIHLGFGDRQARRGGAHSGSGVGGLEDVGSWVMVAPPVRLADRARNERVPPGATTPRCPSPRRSPSTRQTIRPADMRPIPRIDGIRTRNGAGRHPIGRPSDSTDPES